MPRKNPYRPLLRLLAFALLLAGARPALAQAPDMVRFPGRLPRPAFPPERERLSTRRFRAARRRDRHGRRPVKELPCRP